MAARAIASRFDLRASAPDRYVECDPFANIVVAPRKRTSRAPLLCVLCEIATQGPRLDGQ
jgi:hypothetical protein